MCLYLHYTLWLKAISNLIVHLIVLRHKQTLMEVHGVLQRGRTHKATTHKKTIFREELLKPHFVFKSFCIKGLCTNSGRFSGIQKLSQKHKSMRGRVVIHTSGRNTSLGQEVDTKYFSPQNMQQDAQTLCCVLLKKMRCL